MAKNITRHVQHIKSVDTTTITVDGQDVVVAKLPEWGDLKDGEIAVNYKDGYETISIRNNNNEVVAFPNINTVNTLIDEKAQAVLTFDSTPTANSVNPVTSDGIKTYVDNGDKIQALTTYQSSTPLAVGDTHDQALSKLSKIIDDNEIITARALTDLNDTKQDEIEDLDEIRTGAALGATALQTETQLSKGTTTGSGNAVTDINVDNHQITLTKGATFLTEHQDLSAYADGAEYDSTNHYIYLKHGNTRLANPINAADFIKDGMVNSVRIGVLDDSSDDETRYLIVTFNTDAGLEDIEIPLTDIFDPSLYYTKEEIDDIIEDNELSISTKQDKLDFDDTPTAGSDNPVTSGGIKSYVDTAIGSLGNIVELNEPSISTPLAVGDTYDQAFSKLTKIIRDNELTTAGALTDLYETKGEKPLIITFTKQGNGSNGETLLTPSVTLSEAAEAYKNGRQLIGQIEAQQGMLSEFIINTSFSAEDDNNNYYAFKAENIFLLLTAGDFEWSNLNNNTEVCKLTEHLNDVFKTTNATATNLTNTQAVRFGYDDSLTEDTNTYYPNGSGTSDTIAFYSLPGNNRHAYINLTLPSSATGLQLSTSDLRNFSGGVYDTKIKFTVPNDNFFVNIDYELTDSSFSPVVLGGDIKNFSAGTVVELDYMVPLNSTGGEWIVHTNKAETETNRSMTEVTYSELKTLRDNGELTPGSYYRITDYNCTTTQANTQSAGHQFDIVLLALSENKLCEEGWACMHDNIYEVTFQDDSTSQCYIHLVGVDQDSETGVEYTVYNVVDCKTLLGTEVSNSAEYKELIIDEITKTAKISIYSTEAIEDWDNSLQYNYFQNSNLEAWKIWYCLDNNKTKYNWADDSVDESTEESITATVQGGGGAPTIDYNCIRDTSKDRTYQGQDYYGWVDDSSSFTFYTKTENISIGEGTYTISGGGAPASSYGVITAYTPAHEGTGLPNGRGVIYRLIDEWGNDCPYDFKNIQFKRPLDSSAHYSTNGTDTWVYTFNAYIVDTHSDNSLGFNLSTIGGSGMVTLCHHNIIKPCSDINNYQNIIAGTAGEFVLNDTVFLNMCYSLNNPTSLILLFVERNVFDVNSHNNTLSMITNNVFGMNFNNNVLYGFGGSFGYNSFGHNCNNCKFYDMSDSVIGNDVNHVNFATDLIDGYVVHCTVEDGVEYVTVSNGTGAQLYLRDLTILRGVRGTSSSQKTLSITSNMVDNGSTTPIVYQPSNTNIVSV